MDNNNGINSQFNTSTKCQDLSMESVKYRNINDREKTIAPDSSISKPNYEDILKRVTIVIHQHITTCEDRLSKRKHNSKADETSGSEMFHKSQMEKFLEENFIAPQYAYKFIRTPGLLKTGFMFGLQKIHRVCEKPTLAAVHEFLVKIFIEAKLSAECSIVCLIYVERLMENANVPLLASTWRPCLLCGLLLASKVWQDISSWNSEIASIYPEYSLQSINKLERIFCMEIKWKLYISTSCYAKYYYSLRSLTEKKDFRRNYNAMMVDAPGAQQIAARTGGIKNVIETVMSRSL